MVKVVFYKTIVRLNYINSYNLGFGYIQAYCLDKLKDVEMKVVYKWQDILKEKPDIIAISCVTELWELTKHIINELRKDYDGLIVLGGQHISALPELLPENVDCAVLGEGEETFKEIIENYQKYKHNMDFSKIEGVAYNNLGQILITKPRKFLDMDLLPLPVDIPKDYFPLSTSRGCLYRCTHCIEGSFHHKLRLLSAEKLANIMITHYDNTGNLNYEFLDDLFIAVPSRLFDLHSILKKKGLLNRFKISKVSLNANLINEEIIKTLKEIGVINAGIGIESLSEPILKKFKKGVVTLDHIINALKIAKKYDFYLGGSIVIGYPGETENDLKTTLNLINQMRTDYNFQFWTTFLCQPLPGSELWYNALNKGELSLNMDFSQLRIDADLIYFDTPYYYGNQNVLPLDSLHQILEDEGFLEPGKFKFLNKEEKELAKKFKDYYENLEDKSNIKQHFENNVESLIKSLSNKKILIFGIGKHSIDFLNKYDLSKIDILGFVQTVKTSNNEFFGYKVYSLSEIKEIKPDAIVISSKRFEIEIYQILLKLNLEDIQICKIYDEFVFT